MERVAIFIDGSNLYHNVRQHCNRTDLDLQRLAQWLLNSRQLIRTYYYNAPLSSESPGAPAQQRFFARLKGIPYFTVRLGRLEPRGATMVEKGVDVALTVDMVAMAYKDTYDTAVLVSNDADFSYAVEAVCNTGKHVEVACFRGSAALREAADKVIELSSDSLGELFLTP